MPENTELEIKLAEAINNLVLSLDLIEIAKPEQLAKAQQSLQLSRKEAIDLLDEHRLLTD